MVKSRSKISRQPVKKSKKTAARTARGGSREKSRSAEAAARAAPSKTAAKGKKRKWVYAFGGGKAQGRAGMHNLNPNGATEPPHSELSIQIFQKENGIWRVGAFHNTTVAATLNRD